MHTPPLRIEDVPERLRAMRARAGDPSYAEIARRITAARADRGPGAVVSRATVYDCFRDGRRRFDVDLLIAIVRALAPDDATVASWSSALAALGERAAASGLVSVTDTLPTAVTPFVGRTRELAQLRRVPGAHWIHAMPGAGKTSLALQAARAALAAGTITGVVVADLRGHSPAGPPADPHAVVRAVLRLLGDTSKGLTTPAARRVLRGRLVATRTMLILDDAASAEQVAVIVSQPAGAAVTVTSRVVPGVGAFRPLALELFAPYESLALLDAIAGREAIERDPAAAEALLELTDHQPLAVSITAARVAARGTWTLGEHLDLARTRRASLRLDEPVARSLDLTYQLLPEPAQRLLRALAAHPVALLDRSAVAAIAGEDAAALDAALAALEEHSLLVRDGDGRLRMHELIRVHALDLAVETDPSSARRAAAARLRQNAVDRAWSAHRALARARRSAGRAPRAPVDHLVIDATEAERFFTDALDLLLHVALTPLDDAADDAADGDSAGLPPVTLIAETLDDALHRAGRSEEAIALFREALRVARERGDGEGELRALVDLGAALTQTGRFAEAETVLAHLDPTVPGWPAEAPRALNALGTSLLSQGRFAEARARLDEAVAAASALDDRWREGQVWNNIALLHLHAGDLDDARAALTRSIDLAVDGGDLVGAARGRINLAKLLHDLGDNPAAETQARAGLTAMESLGHVPGIVVATSNLAAVVVAQGRVAESAALARTGLDAARDAGMRQTELELLRTLGLSQLGQADPAAARTAFDAALALAGDLGDRLAAAACLEDLGDCAHAAGDDVTARRRWRQAVAAHEAVDSPYAHEPRAKLAGAAGVHPAPAR